MVTEVFNKVILRTIQNGLGIGGLMDGYGIFYLTEEENNQRLYEVHSKFEAAGRILIS